MATSQANLTASNDLENLIQDTSHSDQCNTPPPPQHDAPTDFVEGCRCNGDSWGRDHYLVWISLKLRTNVNPTRTARGLNRVKYKEKFAQLHDEPEERDLRDEIAMTLQPARVQMKLSNNSPAPTLSSSISGPLANRI